MTERIDHGVGTAVKICTASWAVTDAWHDSCYNQITSFFVYYLLTLFARENNIFCWLQLGRTFSVLCLNMKWKSANMWAIRLHVYDAYRSRLSSVKFTGLPVVLKFLKCHRCPEIVLKSAIVLKFYSFGQNVVIRTFVMLSLRHCIHFVLHLVNRTLSVLLTYLLIYYSFVLVCSF